MKALVKISKGQGNVKLTDMPEPVCAPDEVKIKIMATGICGTDLHILHGEFDTVPPVILGHEFCGQVVEKGDEVTKFEKGDRVVAENVCIGCGRCNLCLSGHYALCNERKAQGVDLNGGFSEYVTCKENYVYKIPDNISFEEGALIEPLVCCTHGVTEQANIHAGDRVLVTGPGAIGLLCAQLAKAEGAFVILAGTDKDTERLQTGERLGIDRTINIEKIDIKSSVAEWTNNEGVDVFIECSGVEAAACMGIEMLRKRGNYLQVGLFGRHITMDFEKICFKELNVGGTLSHTRDAWTRGLLLVEQGKVQLKPLVTRVHHLYDWEKAFEDFVQKREIKIVLTPNLC